ncbi:polyisoprenoid-binding protein YceI [Thermosporothrix hazakensis]|jgi:polyisoprenoid-binding protein YceI|uniref:Polyisoprenoid-binding protein YceI n=1 Tax=Thermosporothrix hazakensis TaxID=644383 RepID=A0A326U5G4_THEHA|nr:YceI family protein [Thermosporothrix hazakensis]PZW27077.1 polyisoprenoid-binding protein YceI [Thermosporothrix hazakensis]GCE50362.1 hypothetical protein KTH_52310 [Thermosporothrix hazakensis]
MRRPHWIALFSLLISGLLFAACGGSTQGNNSATDPQTTPTTQATATPWITTTPGANQELYTIVAPPTEASYEVQEQFLEQNLPTTAIGKTNSVEGGFLIQRGDKPIINDMKITIDLRTLKSDQERRDNALRQRWLESNTYPYATFVAKNVQTLPAGATEGKTLTFPITGDLTIRNVTRQETFQVTGKLEGDTITGKATTKILMKNYNFEPPSIAGFLTVEDGVTLTINFTAKKG